MKTHKLNLLDTNAKYGVTTARQLQRRCFPKDADGRIARGHLSELVHSGLIHRTRMEVLNPLRPVSASCYYPSPKGLQLLALEEGKPEYLHISTQRPDWRTLAHRVQLTDLHITFDEAIGQQTMVTMPTWYNESDVVNQDAVDPIERFKLYVLIQTQPKRICCIPDAAFVLSDGRYAKANYIELETGSSHPNKAAAEKSPGYAGLCAQKLHRKHFPNALEHFSVLVFAPHPEWRRQLQRAFAKKEGASLYRFASLTDVNPATILTAPIFYRCEDGPPIPLVKGGAK